MASEAEARRKVLATYRTHFPSPTSCADAIQRLPDLEAQLIKDKTQGSKENGPRWVEAGETVIKEFKAYIAECNKYAPTNPLPTVDAPPENADAVTKGTDSTPSTSGTPSTAGNNNKLIIGVVAGLLLLLGVVVIIKRKKS